MKIKISKRTEKEILEKLKATREKIAAEAIDLNFVITMQIAAGTTGLAEFIKKTIMDEITLPKQQSESIKEHTEIEITGLCDGTQKTLAAVQERINNELGTTLTVENIMEFALQLGGAYYEGLLSDEFAKMMLAES